MEASQTKLSAAVVVLLLVMAAETGPVQARECLSQSTTFNGLCLSSDSCNDKCLQESSAYSGGKCGGLFLRCFCITPCKTTTLLAAPEASPAR
ncbi:hypothetical protein BAE44_0015860 [Dichanthelium oligosanthes]|uniref:Knottins-like domain-containing protein n=1 Tax=Dichanthelium oligosanthes TaxID=888268 RepID=A0A1E5VD95_9POAL|nr:hypothetical protein BAE44_0015860 [Dichanthelium oligosanthes]